MFGGKKTLASDNGRVDSPLSDIELREIHRELKRNKKQLEKDRKALDRERARTGLAKWVVVGSLSLILIFGAAVVIISFLLTLPPNTKEMQAAELTNGVFAAVLAVVSAWVSSVLAFYFVNQTADNANQTALKLAGKRSVAETVQRVSVREVMRLPTQIEAVTLRPEGDPERYVTSIAEVLKLFQRGRTRAPLYVKTKDRRVLRYVLHESTVYSFLWRKQISEEDAKSVTVQDLLEDQETGFRLYSTLAYLPESASLSDAKAKMDADKRIQDVVITADGGEEGDFVGWLTNVDVMRKCIAGAYAADED